MQEDRKCDLIGVIFGTYVLMHWLYYILQKLIKLGVTLLGVSLLTFLLFNLAPGNTAETILKQGGEKTDPDQIRRLERRLGLDQPLHKQYMHWLGRVLHGDLGRSYVTGDAVLHSLQKRWSATARLAAYTFIFILVFSTLGGILSALHQGGLCDAVHRLWTVLNISIPDYLLGQILILIFSVELGLIPFMSQNHGRIILPVLTLGLSISAMQGRVLRTRILEILSQDYIRFSLAKGLSRTRIIWRHVLKNALGPVLTLWGVCLGHMLGGTVIVETVFAWPGIGKMCVDAALNRDFPLLQGAVLIMTTCFVLVNQIIDLLYPLLDPKLRRNGQI